jgi:hypothetical protein
MQASAREAGISYLEESARNAAQVAGVEYLGCNHDQAQVSGSGETYQVEACGSRVAVHCTWGAGAPSCTPEPELEAARAARDARAEAARRAAPPAPAPAPTTPSRPSVAEGAAFRVDDAGVLSLDAYSGYLELHARTSAEHRDQVVLSTTITAGDSPACDHALTILAAGEPLHVDASRRDGATTHYVVPAELFDSLGERVPLRMTVCEQTFAFGHRELRALRAFIERHRAL